MGVRGCAFHEIACFPTPYGQEKHHNKGMGVIVVKPV